MGYTTEFSGSVTVSPPLNAAEIAYINKFGETRRMNRKKGPYFVDGTGDFGQGNDADIINHNSPPAGQPGLWCQWEASEDGSEIKWNGAEKFYDSEAWMAYLIDNFLKPGAAASRGKVERQFADFTFDHFVNGDIHAEGEDREDVWTLCVRGNEVSHSQPGYEPPALPSMPAANDTEPAVEEEDDPAARAVF